MRAHEKKKLLADLERGRQTLLDVLAGVTEELAARKPAPEKWSILECVEHLAVSEEYLLSQIAVSVHSDTPAISRNREVLIVQNGLDRKRKFQSPEVGRPTGRFATLARALQEFLAHRQRTILYVTGCGEDLRCRLTTHPMIATVNCYEVLLMIAVHPLRHVKQIEEIKAL